jgi:hypothetical protein
MDAVRLGGDVTYLSPEEVALCVENVENTNERAWALWKKQALSKKR